MQFFKQQNQQLYHAVSDFSFALNEFSEFIVCPMSYSKLANYICSVEIRSPCVLFYARKVMAVVEERATKVHSTNYLNFN